MKHFSALSAVRIFLVTWWLLAGVGSASAQAPGWSQLALPTMTPSGGMSIIASAADANGNIFVVGGISGTTTIAGTTFTFGSGQSDYYVAKWNSASGYVWAVRAGGTPGSSNADQAYIRPTGIALVGSSIYIAGTYSGPTAAFGATILLNAGQFLYTNNSFVAKLTDAGTSASFSWATRLSAASIIGSGFALTALGASRSGVYVAGWFQGGTLDVGSTTLTNAGIADLYVAKLSDAGTSGSVVWAQRAGGPFNDQCAAMAVRGSDVYLTGFTNSAPATFGTVVVPAIGSFVLNAYVAKLTDAGSNGTFQWATRAGAASASSSVVPTAIVLSGPAVYVAGNYFGNVGFGPTTLPVTGSNDYDVFVAKLTDAGTSGTFNWGVAGGSTKVDDVGGLAANGSGVYVGGRFTGPTATFGATALTNPNTPSLPSAVYVTRISDGGASGAFAWAQSGGASTNYATSYQDNAAGVVLTAGRGYLLGNLAGSYNGNPTTPTSTTATFGSLTQTTQGTGIGFIATWLDNSLLATAPGKAAGPLSLWPNPAHGAATVRLPAGDATPLMLLDGLGRVVRRYPAPLAGILDAVLDLRGLPAGQYVLRGAGRAQRLTVE